MARRPGPPCSLGRRHALHPGVNGRGRSALPGSSTRALALFFLVNSILLNLLLAALPWTPERKTVFNYTARALIGRARSDSWTQMHVALQELRAAPDRLLYHHLFFHRHMRFPYAPPSLFLTALIERLPLDALRVLHLVSWLVLAGTVAICVRLFRQSMAEDEGSTGAGQVDRVAGPVLVAAFTLTFYPVVKGFTLGQIQTWLNLALAAALSSWMAGHEVRAGVLSALPCLVKPHYGLLLLWGLSRRRWRFCVAFGAVLGGAFLVSIAAFGWANHRDYLWMLAYVSAHGESFFANASVNGILQRALFNGDNLGWHEDAYPPFNAWVYGGTVLASLALVSGCLLWRPRGSLRASAADLMLAILTCVMASPVAWEHHYGILMPFYAVLLPALVRRPVFGRATIPYLGASYVLTSNYLGITQLTASTRANLLQSYLLAGAVLVLVCLYRLRAASETSAESGR